MSSLTNRSATGAVKTKVQNVNSVYSGKNQLQGGKPVGRNGGLTAIGKASGVVRRMPPPPTLPSLRAESQGQDPDIAIVPQGGTGWSKSDTSTASATAAPPAASPATSSESKASLTSAVSASAAASGVDMRPAWAKPQATAAPPTETTPVAGYPSLATAAAAANEETRASRTWRSSGSMSEEPLQELPARFYDGGSGPVRPYQPARFQGSSDARATQPGATYGAPPVVAAAPRQTGGERWSTSEASRETIPEEPTKKAETVIEPAPRAENSHDYTKRNGGAADDQQPSQQPHHEYRLLKRPATATTPQQQQQSQTPRSTAATLADLNRAVEDDDEELRMTKLSKPATRVMKRCGPGSGSQADAAADSEVQQQQPKEERRQQKQTATAAAAVPPAPSSPSQERYSEDDHSSGQDASSQPSQPAENIWEKRKEERASAERERVSQLRQARTLEAAMAQHFPSVAEAATMRVDKESTRKPADADFARVALRARRGPVVNDVRALQEDGVVAAAAVAAPPPRPRQQPMLQQRRRPDEEYGGEYGGGYDRRREYDDRRQYDGPQQRGYERPYRSDYGRQEYGRPEEERRAEEYDRDERGGRPEKQEGSEEAEEDRGASNNGPRREYPSRGGRGGQRGQRGNGYAPANRGERGGQRSYDRRRVDQDESEKKPDEVVQQLQQPSDKRSWRRASPVEGEAVERTPEGQKEIEETEGAPRRRYIHNNGSNSQHQQQPRVTMTRGVRGGRGLNARGSARGAGASATHQRRPQPRDEQQDGGDVTHEKRHAAASVSARPTRGLYAPRGARRGGHEGRNARPEQSAGNSEGSGSAAAGEGEDATQLQPPGNQQRLKSPVASSEGHEEWETASESSQKGERKSRESSAPAAAAAGAARSNGTHSQQSKNGQQPASRTYTTTHAKREGGTKRGERPERQAPRKEPKRVQREESEESVDRLAGFDLHDERRVVIVDDHPASTHITGAEHADFEEVLSKKQKRARAEEEKARAEAEERRLQRERERAERVHAKREKRIQAKTEREEAQRAAKAEAAAKRKAEKEDKTMTTVWNSAQPEARAALESSEAAAAAAAASAAGGVSVDATAAAAASDVLPSPIARPRGAAAPKKPAVDFVGGARGKGGAVKEKYEFMFDEEAARAAAAQKETEDSDERVTLAPSEAGSAVTTDDQRRLTENVNLCKELWSSGEVACSAAAAAGVVPVAPLMVHAAIAPSSVSSAHHSPNAAAVAARDAAAGVLPTNVAKVKPQPHASVAVTAGDAGDASGASCAPCPPSANAVKQQQQSMMMGMSGGMHSGNSGMAMQQGGGVGGHPQSIMGARSPAGMTSSFNQGFGDFGGIHNVFASAPGMGGGLTTNGVGFKTGMQAVSPSNMHGAPYGSRLHSMQQQQQRPGTGFEQSGGLFPHPANRSSNSGWPPFDQMVPPSSTTPPIGNHHQQMGGAPRGSATNAFGLFGAQPPQQQQQLQQSQRPPSSGLGGPFAAPPPMAAHHMQHQQQQLHGGGPSGLPSVAASKNNTMMPPLFPEMMNMPPPSLGAVGDRARQLQQSQQQQQMQHHGGYGDSRGFAMPPPMGGGAGGGLFSRPPPATDMWKGGTPALQQMQQSQSGRSFGNGPMGGGQYGSLNNNGRMMQSQPHHNQGMHGGSHHHSLPPQLQQHQMQQQQQQPYGGGDTWMQQGGGGGSGHFGGSMGRAMNMGGRGDNNAMWRS